MTFEATRTLSEKIFQFEVNICLIRLNMKTLSGLVSIFSVCIDFQALVFLLSYKPDVWCHCFLFSIVLLTLGTVLFIYTPKCCLSIQFSLFCCLVVPRLA